jgi:hypothetical protein
MQRRRLRLLTAFAALLMLLLAAAAGCGSSGSSSSTGGGISQFKTSGANKTIVDFGEEAASDVREAAGSVLAANLKAREAADFASQCSTMSQKLIEKLVNSKNNDPVAACPSTLRKLAEPLQASKGNRKDTLGGTIAAMRIDGNLGYGLYHGTDGKNYAMPMEREGDAWKVASILTIGL